MVTIATCTSLSLAARARIAPHPALLASLLLAAGCASVPLAPTDIDRAAKAFQPPPGKASVYVFRPDAFKLSAITVGVTVDGYGLGINKAGTFLYADLAPGRHVLLSQSEKEMPVAIELEADHCYFFQQDVSFGTVDARSALLRVDDATGRDAVTRSRMAVSQVPAP